MLAMRRAMPFIVAATTGVLSGIYVFKPLFANRVYDLTIVPSQNIDYQETVTNDKETK